MFKIATYGVPVVGQWVKDPALLQMWHRSPLWFVFDPWPGNFHVPQLWPKNKKIIKYKINKIAIYYKIKLTKIEKVNPI